MRTRLLLAVPVLLLGFAALLFASSLSPSRDAQNSALAVALAHPPKVADRATTAFIDDAAKVERRGYIRRKAGKVRAKGWVSVQSPGHSKDGKEVGETRYFLHADDESIELHPGKAAGLTRVSAGSASGEPFEPGQIVKVSGRADSGGVAVQNVAYVGKVKTPELVPVTNAGTVVHRKVAVVLSYAPDRQGDLVSAETLMGTLETNAKSVRNYFLQLSSNRLSVTFKVFPAVQGRAGKCGDESDYDQLAVTHAAVNAAAALESPADSLDNYDSIVNIVASDKTYPDGNGNVLKCEWFAGGDTYMRNSGFRQQTTSGPGAGTIAHELGHNWGLEHANAAIATSSGAPVAIAKQWRPIEYGDSASLMGFPNVDNSGDTVGMSGPELARIGVIGLNQTEDVTAQAPSSATTLQLRSVDQDLAVGSEPRVLRIRRPSVKDPRAPDAYLYLDLRNRDISPGRFVDQFKPNDPILFGVSVRFGPTYGAGSDSFRVLNSSPGRKGTNAINNVYPYGWNLGNERNQVPDPSGRTKAADEQDFAVAVGQSMYDPVEDLTITTESISGGVAAVKITTGPPPGNPTSVSVSGSRLYVTAGSGRRNNVVLSENEGRVIVTDVGNRVVASAGCKLLNPQAASCSRTAIKSATVSLDEPGETFSDLGAVYGNLNLPVTWDGGGGQDSLEGGPGDDTFIAGPGDDTFAASPGDEGGADSDLFTGNGGNDRVTYSGRSSKVKVLGSNVRFSDGGDYAAGGQTWNEGDQVSSDITGVIGGAGDDEIQLGVSTPQYLEGGAGADQLKGGPAADTIVARDGSNTDTVTCGSSIADKVYRDGSDALVGCTSSLDAPMIQFTTAPAEGAPTKEQYPKFGFYATEASGIAYTCKVESGSTPGTAPLSPCSTSGSLGSYTMPTSPAEGGPYVFTVVGTMPGGAQTTVSRTFRVDRTAPTVTITSGPPASTDPTGSNFELGFTDAGTPQGPRFECALQTAPFSAPLEWESCAASVRFPALLPGSYRLTVRALDEPGNVSTTVQQDWAVTYDTILNSALDVRTIPSGQVQFNSERPAFDVQASGPGATLWCKVDTAPWGQCGGMPWRPSALDLSAPHTIQLAAGDANGPTDATPLSYASYGSFVPFAVDTRLTAGPEENEWLTVASTQFKFEGFRKEYWHGRDVTIPDNILRYECRYDTVVAWFPCTGTFNMSPLSEGAHTFWARAVRVEQSAAGKVVGQRIEEDWTPIKRKFNVDTIAPTVAFQSPSPADNGWVAGPNASFTFSTTNASDSAIECKLDGAAWAACTSPVSLSGLSSATHTFSVRATDPAQHASTDTRTFDVGEPDAEITDGPPAGTYTNNATPTFTFTGSHATATFECAIGSTSTPTYNPCTSPWTVPAQAAGSNVFRVRAKLPTGQVDPTPDGRLVFFDYTAPTSVPTIDSGPPNGSTVTTDDTSFGFSVTGETGPKFDCRLDSGSWTRCTSPAPVQGVTNGSHTWTVRVVDRAGNIGPSATPRTFTVVKPKVLAVSSATTTPTNVTLSTSPSGSGSPIDWIHWPSAYATSFDHMSGGAGLPTWVALQSGQYAAQTLGGTYFGWTDNADSPASGQSLVGTVSGRADGAGFRLPVPATSAAQRKLRVYVGYKGAGKTFTLAAKFGDNVVEKVDIAATSDTRADRYIDVTYRPTGTDTLTVTWSQTAGGTSTTAAAILYAAVLS